MFERLLQLFPLVAFFVIISLVFYQILTSTKNVLLFLSILFAFYIIFRYVMASVEVIYDRKSLPLVTKADLDKYSLEQGVELRELQEQFVNEDNYLMTDEDDDDE